MNYDTIYLKMCEMSPKGKFSCKHLDRDVLWSPALPMGTALEEGERVVGVGRKGWGIGGENALERVGSGEH